MNQKNRKIVVGLVVGVLLLAGLFFRIVSREKLFEVDSSHRVVMGTFAHIIVIAEDSDTAQICIETAFDQLEKVDNLMSTYKEDSQISKLNRDGFERAVKVSEWTFEVLQKSIEFSELSEGAFDITVKPLIDLWRAAGEANSVPSDEQLQEAKAKVGFEKLVLDSNEMTVKFSIEGMKLDLGGIAKGFAIDKAVEAMQQKGAIGGMVDVGGDIRCFGKAPKGRKHWRIALQDPRQTQVTITGGKGLLVLELDNAAVATSGDYRRFVLVGGRKHSHILDIKTGKGSNKLSSVSIIAQNATDADALATAVSVMGKEKGLAMIEGLAGVEAIVISPDGLKLSQTAGAAKFVRKN